MTSKIPKTVVMVRPAKFGFNVQTANNNAFQHKLTLFSEEQIQDIVLLEFNNMVKVLKDNGIHVHVFDDHKDDLTPDSIFPNNWFSTFTNEVILYPMFSENRRKERKDEVFTMISALCGKGVNKDLLPLENEGYALEGTGSLVCDYKRKIAFAAISQRTSEAALDKFETLSGYQTVRFESTGPDGNAIYHTNVMLSICDHFCMVGSNTIKEVDRERVISKLQSMDKEIIELDNEQVFKHFAGNVLQLSNDSGDKFLVMSNEAKRSLTKQQLERIGYHGSKIISVPIHMIERVGGGSARCMMAEFFSAHEND